MAKQLSQAELAKIGAKVVEQNEKAKVRGKARGKALQRLVGAHETEFDGYMDQELKNLGVS